MKVVLLGRMGCVAPHLLRAGLECECELVTHPDVAQAGQHPEIFADADVIVGGPITPEIAASAGRLKLFHAGQAGMDRLGIELLGPGVTVCRTFNHEVSIAEYVMMAMLMLRRHPQEQDRELRQGTWNASWIWGEFPALRVLQGETVLILGLGHIAAEIVRRAGVFGMRVVGVSRQPRPHAGVDRVVGYDTWREEISQADFLIPCCPLTQDTEGLIGKAELALAKPGACLINIARGGIVDETALYEALRDGRLGGAAIDVWYRYPKTRAEKCHPSRLPFHELQNVIMTPHVSGWTEQTAAGRMRDIAANINRLACGQPLQNVVERSAGAG